MAKIIKVTLAGRTIEFVDKDAETLITAIRKAVSGGSAHAIVTGGRLECMVSKMGTAQHFGDEANTAGEAGRSQADY